MPGTSTILKHCDMKSSKHTLVLGASDNPTRYSYLAALRLTEHGHPVTLIGNRKGMLNGIPIQTDKKPLTGIHTVTLYLRPELQQPMYDYIFSLHPNRIIFNPGTENSELKQLAESKGIETTEACTLVMLSIGNY